MRKWLWILLFPLVAQAAGEGTWQASSIGDRYHRLSRCPV